ncbi:Alpha/Beta hydrolase protein, partial [Paraphysoderma sedebokerense]
FAPWQIVLATLTAGYTLSKLSLLTFMNGSCAAIAYHSGPEPFARYYSKNFYRATWIMTALDAGFWTAMKLRPKFLRDFFSLVFTLYYLVFADKAEEKVRRLRMTPTVELLRTSWEKQKHPLFTFLRRMDIPKITTFGKRLEIPRNTRAWGYDPDRPETRITNVYLYYHGSPEQFAKADKLILQCPGGGFVCMDPICHEDYLTLWAKQHEGVPILSIDYKKAPEYPYPYAAEECFEIYKLIRETNGECIGLEGWKIRKPKEPIKITLIGDSAGGNLAASTVVRIVENPTPIIAPSALILVYPLLNFDFACWIPPTQMRLLRTESLKAVNSLVDLHSSQYLNQVPQSPTTPTGIVIEDEDSESPSLKRKKSFFEIASNTLQTLRTQKPHSVFDDYGKSGIQNTFAPAPSIYDKNQDAIHVPPPSHHGRPSQQAHAPLALTSRMSYFSCRVLPPETMRALALLYLGPSQVGVNLHQNYHLSPVLARNEILEKFPKTYFLVGEKDPLVDDTVVFAGRLREAKKLAWKRRQMDNKFLGANLSNSPSDTDVAEVAILEGVSHAFMHLMMFLPEAKDSVKIVSGWFNSIFKNTQKDMIVGGRD